MPVFGAAGAAAELPVASPLGSSSSSLSICVGAWPGLGLLLRERLARLAESTSMRSVSAFSSVFEDGGCQRLLGALST